jgi:hypothetical protein
MINRRNSPARQYPTTIPKEFKFLRKWAEKYFNTLLIVSCMYVVMNPEQ